MAPKLSSVTAKYSVKSMRLMVTLRRKANVISECMDVTRVISSTVYSNKIGDAIKGRKVFSEGIVVSQLLQ